MTISAHNTRSDALLARREELLTVKEFADVLRLNPATVWRMVRQNRLPGAIRIGREIRIDFPVACTAPDAFVKEASTSLSAEPVSP